MKRTSVTLKDVQAVYGGPEADLWELVMGEQIHAGGMMSSLALAKSAGIASGMRGVDLCCCLGAGMRLLAHTYGVRMCGVDATERMVEEARRRTEAAGLSDNLEYRLGDVTDAPVKDGEFDFVWGEDAWCYVVDKDRLIREAARVLKPGGIVAFTDWIEGPRGLSDDEAARINTFMKFPDMQSLDGWAALLEKHGFQVKESVEIDFAVFVDLYMQMLTTQLTSDALRILGNDQALFEAMGAEMEFMRQAAHAGKITRGRFVGVKKG
ncbi:MAG: methyltransferase domain-containing protein [Deltaproteobacteria bacterium]|nr:methyltransferase domain-containing protein [Deltaproteobacteria bacterium]